MTRQAADVGGAGQPPDSPALSPGEPGSAPAGQDAPEGTAGGTGRPRHGGPWRATFFTLVAVAIVAGVAWALLDSRFFVVRHVAVTGTHLVSAAEVRSAAAIPPGIPLIRVDGAVVAHRVDQIRQVESAQVTRDWPDGVTITVTERRPALAVPSGQGYQLIDRDGVAVEFAPQLPPGMPRLILPAGSPLAALRGSPAVSAAAQVLQQLPRWVARRVVAVQAPGASEVTLRLTRHITVVWGSPDRSAIKAKVLGVLMHTHAHTYDVSAPGTAVTSG
jgi:cell division protein FtsQ